MSKTSDGYGANTYHWGEAGTGGEHERLDVVDRERDARVGWTKGGRLKIEKKATTVASEKRRDEP